MAIVKYASNDGTRIYAMKLSSAKAEIAGTAPTGAVTEPIRAKVTRSKRENGFKPRYVTATTPNGATVGSTVAFETFPVLTKSAFDGSTFALGATLTYKTLTYTIVSKQDEDGN